MSDGSHVPSQAQAGAVTYTRRSDRRKANVDPDLNREHLSRWVAKFGDGATHVVASTRSSEAGTAKKDESDRNAINAARSDPHRKTLLK